LLQIKLYNCTDNKFLSSNHSSAILEKNRRYLPVTMMHRASHTRFRIVNLKLKLEYYHYLFLDYLVECVYYIIYFNLKK